MDAMADDWRVYVLRSQRNGRYYTGSTNDLARRLDEHARHASTYTRYAGPFDLVYDELQPDRLSARRRERWFKTGRGREELQRILNDTEGTSSERSP
jgi:putative endonuclease